jgi:hypothetical protein
VTQRKSAITIVHVDDFGLSGRAYNVLVDLEVETVSDLVRLSADELLRHQRNAGRKTVAEIEAFAQFLGVRLGSEESLATDGLEEIDLRRVDRLANEVAVVNECVYGTWTTYVRIKLDKKGRIAKDLIQSAMRLASESVDWSWLQKEPGGP